MGEEPALSPEGYPFGALAVLADAGYSTRMDGFLTGPEGYVTGPKPRRTRRKACDDDLGWILVSVYPRGGASAKWYKTFAGAERQQKEMREVYRLNTRLAPRCFIVQTSEVERWHKSTGVDELERMFRL